MTIRVLFDGQIFIQKYGGISRYFCELMQGLDTAPDFRRELGVKCFYNAHLRESSLLPACPVLAVDDFCFGLNFRGKHRLYRFFGEHGIVNNLHTNLKLSERLLRQGDYDIFHPTYFDPYFLPFLKGRPYVLTVYDMNYELFPDMFHPTDRTADNMRQTCRNAKIIIAISENTKRDLMHFYNIPEEKILVVHLASSLHYESDIPFLLSLPERYLLFVGNRSIYKNFNRMAQAVAPLLHEENSLQVVCAGGGVFTTDELKQFDNLKCSGRFHHVAFNDDRSLAEMYHRAAVFIFPSLYEGFGIPVLEAFSCNCPTALSNTSSFPEVAGSATEYFNPEIVESITNAIRRVIYDSEKQQHLRWIGKERLKLFSWEKTIAATKMVYRTACHIN